MVCYLALFAMVNYVQVIKADELNNKPENNRAIVRDFDRARGRVVSADGVVLAETVDAAEGDRFEFQRQYPTGDLFGHITGYFNFSFGATGIEATYNDELAGQTAEQEYQSLSDLFVERERVADVTLTIRADVQQLAREALGDQEGSVVAIDPRDGSVLALWSFPSFDPSPLSTHDLGAAQDLKTALEADPNRPLRARSWQERFFPGSTFKIITGSAGVESGLVTTESPSYPVASEYDIDFTENELNNFGGSTCGGALLRILAVSCNTAFAAMAADTLGPAVMVEGAERFGFNQRPPIDLPAAATSVFPTEFPDDQGNGPLARAGIGQGDVSASPLQMALATAGIANNGIVMQPYVAAEIRDDEGEVLDTRQPQPWAQAMGGPAAEVMRQGMLGVVAGGSASGLAIDGVEVGGKTGTAQLGTDPPSSHAWIVGFAGPPGGQPTVAVAVIVEAQPGVSEVTGGRVAAPIAKAVMEKVLEVQAAGS